MREHFEQAEKETFTFRPSLVTGQRARSPSPQRVKSQHQQQQQQQEFQEVEHYHENGEVDNTPLKPIYHFGQENPENLTIDIVESSSPQVENNYFMAIFY